MTVTREHIIAEIKRTAELNGGEPLGVDRFSKDTTIAQHDWCGKYWVRWNDAVKEAGLQPREFSQPAFSKQFLTERLIELIRELNHFPIDAEIKMKARTDTNFPSIGPFKKFGNKDERIRNVLEYCLEGSGFEDVVAICEPLIVKPGSATKPVSNDNIEFGFVYLMKSGKYYKIGHTNAVGRREYELAIQLPDKLTTVHVIKTDDPSGIEAYWHKRFQDKRKNGEWFELSPDDIKTFKRRNFM